MILVIVLSCLAALYLIFLLNSKHLWLQNIYQETSILKLERRAAGTGSYQKFMAELGSLIARVLPQALLKKLEQQCFNLNRGREDLYRSIAEAALVAVIMLLAYLINHSWFFILLAFLVPALIMLEINIAQAQFNKELETSIEHLVRCLKVLVVKTETPLINALEIMLEDLPEGFKASRLELEKLVNKSLKSGLRETLQRWKTDLPQYRDFIALLISINDGASKQALQLSFNNFLQKVEEYKADQVKNEAENAQLYLMGPVVVMLIVSSMPMMDAVRFLMSQAS